MAVGVKNLALRIDGGLLGDVPDNGRDGVGADGLLSHLAPLGTVLIEGLGGLFGVAGIEDRLLPQGVRRSLGGLAPVLLYVLGNELLVDRAG